MTRSQDLWTRADELLDARRDPRDDAELASELARDPRAAGELERLARRLARLERAPRAIPAARLAAAALVLLAPLAALLALRGGEREAEPPTSAVGVAAPAPATEHAPALAGASLDLPAPAAATRVLDYRVVVETTRGDERLVTTATPERLERRRDRIDRDARVAVTRTRWSTTP